MITDKYNLKHHVDISYFPHLHSTVGTYKPFRETNSGITNGL